jgi:DNA-directed RNA polymerase subunit RPC12/RpoP
MGAREESSMKEVKAIEYVELKSQNKIDDTKTIIVDCPHCHNKIIIIEEVKK